MTKENPQAKTMSGTVVKKSGTMTVAVQVVLRRQHPKYGKTITSAKKYLAHDPKETAQVGTIVTIRQTRPLSARKRWTIVYDS